MENKKDIKRKENLEGLLVETITSFYKNSSDEKAVKVKVHYNGKEILSRYYKVRNYCVPEVNFYRGKSSDPNTKVLELYIGRYISQIDFVEETWNGEFEDTTKSDERIEFKIKDGEVNVDSKVKSYTKRNFVFSEDELACDRLF